ncbi:MAG: hypothetical protein EGS70_00610 [Clostridiales bacterium]|nr:hypothetical protein [Clostridiales bacterium]
MKLCFKQRFFSWFDSYDIYDASTGATAFTVEGKLAWGHCLHILDAQGRHIATVKERVLTFLPKFDLYIGERSIGTIRKELTLFRPAFVLDFNGWQVEGDFMGDGETRISLYPGEYLSLRYNGAEVARVGNVSERGNGYTAPAGTTIPKGNYTIGEEIPAGTYKIYFSGTTTSRVRVFQDSQEASNTFNKGKETILDWDNTEGIVTLSEGNILRIEYTPIIMTKGGGFSFD